MSILCLTFVHLVKLHTHTHSSMGSELVGGRRANTMPQGESYDHRQNFHTPVNTQTYTHTRVDTHTIFKKLFSKRNMNFLSILNIYLVVVSTV